MKTKDQIINELTRYMLSFDPVDILSPNTVYLLIGASGSGKSRYRKTTEFKERTITLSSDDIRKELFGNLIHQEDHDQIFDIIHKITPLALEMGFDVIYDATNLNRKKRIYFYNDILRNIKKKKTVNVHAVIFIEPFSVILENNNSKPDEEKVPVVPLSRMYQTLQIPRLGVDCDSYEVIGRTNFFSEKMNYEKLISINSLKELMNYVSPEYKKEMKKLFGPHDTPYHLEDINDHIDMCIKNSEDNYTLKVISMFHDLGKSITKDGGKYLSHELVSSVYAMKAFSEIEDMRNSDLITEVIFNHMNAHQGLSEKVMSRNKIDDTSRITNEGGTD